MEVLSVGFSSNERTRSGTLVWVWAETVEARMGEISVMERFSKPS